MVVDDDDDDVDAGAGAAVVVVPDDELLPCAVDVAEHDSEEAVDAMDIPRVGDMDGVEHWLEK